ncbi:uncharacterized protein LOC117176596 [Belonocnema kinseyi]|uniref:uncharacterized protein LOC117176596 n=1 Tax=Belonocnema kinseyi TaxID=2817044 RepID=UPI00143CD6A4|nr:uncharacterized protein LOC117176596 [Belonocnema kinseyi]
MAVECNGKGGAGKGGGPVIVPPGARSQVIYRLRVAVQNHYLDSLLSKKDQGKVYALASVGGASNHFLRNGSFTRFADWRFVHRARLDVLPLTGARRWGDQQDTRCRRCGYTNETLPHVLNNCGPHMVAITRRHDATVQRIVKGAKLLGEIILNKSVPEADAGCSLLRPDIVIRDERSKTVTIIDVAIPFENGPDAFRVAREHKLQKYQPIANSLQEKGYKVYLQAFILGTLGTWDRDKRAVIKHLRIGKRYAGLMMKLMVSDTIRWSRDIYVEHVSGQRQYS